MAPGCWQVLGFSSRRVGRLCLKHDTVHVCLSLLGCACCLLVELGVEA